MTEERESEFAFEARGLGKAYGHVRALENVDLGLRRGELLALVGDNGAGKSTFAKILSGALMPDTGDIFINGTQVVLRTPADALAQGIATVYQDLALVDARDVGANLFLGREFGRGPFVDAKRCRAEAEIVLKKIGAQVPSMKTTVGSLSGGQRQAIAIARAVTLGSQILILDEPTAALGVREATRVMDQLKELKSAGQSILMISHNLQHVLQLSDRIAVFQQGRLAGVRTTSDTSPEEIVQLIMFGPPEAARTEVRA
ncbi:MAG TPA: ATP-binding cassette domain-containing protein [Candidatus Limnocylindrales bacterium]